MDVEMRYAGLLRTIVGDGLRGDDVALIHRGGPRWQREPGLKRLDVAVVTSFSFLNQFLSRFLFVHDRVGFGARVLANEAHECMPYLHTVGRGERAPQCSPAV